MKIRKPANYLRVRHIRREELRCMQCGELIEWLDYYCRHSSYQFHVPCFGELIGAVTEYWWSVL